MMLVVKLREPIWTIYVHNHCHSFIA